MGSDDYFAGRPPPDAALQAPALPVAATRRRGQLPGAVLPSLLALLLLAASAAVVKVEHFRAQSYDPLTAVTTAAVASAGWSPSYVDKAGRPARWDACAAIHYVVQTQWMPTGGRDDLAAALARLAKASGLTFVDDGDTDELPSTQRPSYQPSRYGKRWAPLLIAWVPPAETDLGLGDGVAGVTVAVAIPGPDGGSIVSGQLALDASHQLPRGFGPGATQGEVFLHELGHAVGLGHVLDPTQVMYPQTTNSESQYGAGDRAGLAALGRPAGCHPAPAPRVLHTVVDPAS
jgi:Matrixin